MQLYHLNETQQQSYSGAKMKSEAGPSPCNILSHPSPDTQAKVIHPS